MDKRSEAEPQLRGDVAAPLANTHQAFNDTERLKNGVGASADLIPTLIESRTGHH